MSRKRKNTPRRSRRELEQALLEQARKWILADAGGVRPATGEVTCPKCGDRLGYSITESGKIHGCCSTSRCIWWIDE